MKVMKKDDPPSLDIVDGKPRVYILMTLSRITEAYYYEIKETPCPA